MSFTSGNVPQGNNSQALTPMQALMQQKMAKDMQEAALFSQNLSQVFNIKAQNAPSGAPATPMPMSSSASSFDDAIKFLFRMSVPPQDSSGQTQGQTAHNYDDLYKILGLGFSRPQAEPWDPSKLNVNLGNVKYDSSMGEKLARGAVESASEKSPSGRSKGLCFRGVKDAFNEAGLCKDGGLNGGSAYMAANQLASNPNFKEVSVQRSDLRNLPKGAIVVWSQGSTKDGEHGHVSIALGNGKEASDHIQDQIVNGYAYGGYRVFLPVTQA